MVQLTAKLEFMSEKQLAKVLVHHNYVFKTPSDWMLLHMQDSKDGFLMAKKYCLGKNGKVFIDCEVLQPIEHRGQQVQFSISEPPSSLTKAQLGRGMRDDYVWYIRKLLNVVFGEPETLEDIGLTMSMVETVNQALLNLWCRAPTMPSIP
eukprot:2377970-Rhodomonas_salina.1